MIKGVFKKAIVNKRKGVGLVACLLAVVLFVPQSYAISPPPGTSIINTALVTYKDGSGNKMGCLTATVENFVGECPHLEITTLVSSNPVNIGANIVYTIMYANTGNAYATGVEITDNLSNYVEFSDASHAGVYDQQNNTITWKIGTLAPGKSGSVTIQGKVKTPDDYPEGSQDVIKEGTLIINSVSITCVEGLIATDEISTPVGENANLQIIKKCNPLAVAPGGIITYTISYKNVGNVQAENVNITDQLPQGTSYVSGSATNGGILNGRTLKWNIGILPAGSEGEVSFKVKVSSLTSPGEFISNIAVIKSTAGVVNSQEVFTYITEETPGQVKFFNSVWNETCSFTVGDGICLQVIDPDENINPDSPDTVSVLVESSRDREVVHLTETGINTGIFRKCISSNTGSSIHGDGILTLTFGDRITAIYNDRTFGVDKDLACVDPSGYVYNSFTGQPVSGVIITLIDDTTGQPVPNSALQGDNPVITNSSGYYSFIFTPGAIPTGGNLYHLEVVPPSSYILSTSHPPVSGPDTGGAGYVDINSNGEIVAPTAGTSRVDDNSMPPFNVAGDAGLTYRYSFKIRYQPGAKGNIVLNNIPLDPVPVSQLGLQITKTVNKNSVSIGDLIRYEINVENTGVAPIENIRIIDIMPIGIIYKEGSSLLDGVKISGPVSFSPGELIWKIGALNNGESKKLTYAAVVGSKSHKGDGKNTAVAEGVNLGRTITSNEASATVDINEGVFTTKGTIIGKVFVDINRDGIQNSPENTEDRTFLEKGVPNVVIYMEDGTRVVTDEKGKFSIPGVKAGTHVLRLDKTSLPERLKPVPVNNRFMGSNDSQFVDVKQGGLFKANFAVVEEKKTLEYSNSYSKNNSEEAKLPFEYLTGESKENLKTAEEISLEKKILEMTPELEILNLKNCDIIRKANTDILVKCSSSTELMLFVNGKEIDSSRIGKKTVNTRNKVAIYQYVSIKLNSGEENTIVAKIKDRFGNIRDKKEIKVYCVGKPAAIKTEKEKYTLPADGQIVTEIKITLWDKNNKHITDKHLITVFLNEITSVNEDVDKTSPGLQILYRNGVANLKIKSAWQPGEAEITLQCDDIEKTLLIDFTPHLRDMFIVGMGELVLGSGSSEGNDEYSENNWLKDGFYSGGRGAFFMKGKVGKDILLTASYDSRKDRDDLFRENDTNVESEEKYPIYGDESEVGYEAVSQSKIYVRIDKGNSYAMYGDYHTDFNETRLSAFMRSFNGFKSELNSNKFSLKTFFAHTDRTQVVDTLRGKGISGYYYLSETPVVRGSERIVIEVRDKNNPQRVLNRDYQIRNSDYFIDYDLGTILFKEAIPSYNQEYNPVYIIVTYESENLDKKYSIYGARGTLKPVRWLEMGFTKIHQQQAIHDYQLTGFDLKLSLPLQSKLKVEYATTSGLFDTGGILTPQDDNGWLVEYSGEPSDNVKWLFYYQNTGKYFKNLSAVDVFRGSERFGGELTFILDKNTRIKSSCLNEKDKLNNSTHTLASIDYIKNFTKSKWTFGLFHEESNDKYVPVIQSGSREPFDISEETADNTTSFKIGYERNLGKDLSVIISHRQDILKNEYNLSQAGFKYNYDEHTRIYVKQEYGKYDTRSEMRTVVGAESDINRNTVVYSEYDLEDGADGKRNQQILGLRNKFMLGENITGNFSIENLSTLTGNERDSQPDGFSVATGLEYLLRDDFKLTTRMEYRNVSDENSYLAELGAARKLNADYSLLFRQRFFNDDFQNVGERKTCSTLLGLAYRPINNDRFNALAKFEYKRDKNSIPESNYNDKKYIFSVEGIQEINPHIRVRGKYACKYANESNLDSFTDLISTRFLWDITERFDLGIEYRILNSHNVNSYSHGGSIEMGMRIIKNLWLSVGYSFDKFDEDLTGDYYTGKGPYIKFRFKFDENTFRWNK
ncbi:DUF11 domain-containing protein [bacterium]|nr:DUF11 domain-containing protein [bacterium]